ncbi:sigma-54-dependent Fis family transcriptional regulator [candidate division KSB3 bacterium]|uniref:Sigma-54-dependent Fis family transcriptional regulator n=1 Tax=candidate division KSB3 bacterium TaxID=2044937 RepID=A0A2G6K736_9BACT|nr:MAG: sigma-54-dependent Fis family transcriptional regulator [candidate division KSB3 bacterium]
MCKKVTDEKKHLLIIDDKIKLCKSLAANFDQRGYQTLYSVNGQQGIQLFLQHSIHVVLLDIMLGEESGIDILRELLSLNLGVPIIMITGYGSIDSAVQSIKIGAFDYITKPLDFEKLFKIVENAVNTAGLDEKNSHGHGESIGDLPEIITQNQKLKELYVKAKKLAITDLPILITGENGTGKEVIADFIHAHSARSTQEMLKMNCAAFPETLLDNELFGHEKGAYTGADSAFKGVFERADRSSLFLDEIGDMPLTIQAKILRTLQNHKIRRIGGSRSIKVDVRFIAATNKNLQALIGDHAFREDLFYRLNTAMLHLPPLRERREDVPLLVEYFLSENPHKRSGTMKNVSEAVLELFWEYDWPGNVRELKNTVNYAAAIASNDTIDVEDLPPNFANIEQHHASKNIWEETERNLILKMLQKSKYNKKRAAELLNMSRKTLYNKLEKYGIVTPK